MLTNCEAVKNFHFMAASACFSAKGNRQVCFTDAGRASKNQIRFGFDELTSGQIQYVFLVQLRHISKLGKRSLDSE